MSYQLNMEKLFAGVSAPYPVQELEARSRRTDPSSSRRAAREIERSGVLKGQRLITFNLVSRYPGRTSKELAQLGALDRYQLARRLPELELDKRVRRTEVGHEDCRWWAV